MTKFVRLVRNQSLPIYEGAVRGAQINQLESPERIGVIPRRTGGLETCGRS